MLLYFLKTNFEKYLEKDEFHELDTMEKQITMVDVEDKIF